MLFGRGDPRKVVKTCHDVNGINLLDIYYIVDVVLALSFVETQALIVLHETHTFLFLFCKHTISPPHVRSLLPHMGRGDEGARR